MAYATTASSMTTPIDDEGRCPCHPFVQMSRKSPRTGEWKSMLENCPLCDIDGKSTTSGSVSSPPDSVCSSKQPNDEGNSKNLETRWNMNGTATPPPFVELEVNPSTKATSFNDGRGSVPPPPRRRSRSCNSNSSRVRDSSRVRFQPEKDIQFTTEPVRTRAKSVLRTPKYKVCEELMKQQLDESEKVTTMSMDISLGNVHDDDDDYDDEYDSLNENRTKEVVQQLKDRIEEIDRAEEEDEVNDLPTSFAHHVHENDNNIQQVDKDIRLTERGRDRGRRSYHQVQAIPEYSHPQQHHRSSSQQQAPRDYSFSTSKPQTRSSSQRVRQDVESKKQPRDSSFTPKPNMVVRVNPTSNNDEVSVLSFQGGSILSVPPTRRVSNLSENSDGLLCLPVAEASDKINVLTASSIATMMTNNNEYDPKSGRCVRHPHVRLRKKKLFGRGWKVMMSACPDCCVAELCRIRAAETNKSKLVIPTAINNCVIVEDRSSANDGNGSNNVRGRQGEPSTSMKRSSSCFTSSLRNSVQSSIGNSLRSSDSSGYAGDTSNSSMPSSKMATRMPPPPPSRRSSSQDVFSRAQSLPPKKDAMSINYDEATASLTGSSSVSSTENDRTKRTYRSSVSTLSQVNEEPQREKRGTIHVNRMRWTDPKNGQNGNYTGKVNDRFVPHGYGSMEYDPNPKNDMSGLGVSVMIVKEGKWKEGRFRRPRGASKHPSSACSISSSGSSSSASQNIRPSSSRDRSSSRSRARSTSRSQQQPRHRSSSRAAAA